MNPFDMLKNIQSMKEQLGNIQEELAEITATGSSGGNIVNVTLNGKFEIKLTSDISPELNSFGRNIYLKTSVGTIYSVNTKTLEKIKLN